MSLNPSNAIAESMNPGKTMFFNLARRIGEDVPEDERVRIHREVDEAVRAELMAAGILGPNGKGDSGDFLEAEWVRNQGGEVPTAIFAAKHRWKFTRRWYYYVAEGPGIPPAIAEEFHQTWGTQVRVDGHCGCPSPLEWHEGYAVGMYHIDTQEGLNAFVQLLAAVHKPAPKTEAA